MTSKCYPSEKKWKDTIWYRTSLYTINEGFVDLIVKSELYWAKIYGGIRSLGKPFFYLISVSPRLFLSQKGFTASKILFSLEMFSLSETLLHIQQSRRVEMH